MLRATVREEGQPPLPAIDIDEAAFVIGSSPHARVRLPAGAVRTEHVRIADGRWMLGERSGAIGDGVELEVGAYRVHLAPAPTGTSPTAPQRTESLARELMRGLLGDAATPTLELVRGPGAPAKRTLRPPESTLVIGRGDDASWIIVDNDLSRLHAEIRRSWDGTRLVDLGSKNGTKLDGTRITEAPLHDGAEIELGKLVFRYYDPADRQLAPRPAAATAPAPAPTAPPRSRAVFFAALAIAVLAFAGLVWVLAS